MAEVHVAVGVIVAADGRILLSRRAEGAHQGGLWEFPGGKVEPGEAVRDALERELLEELGIRVSEAEPLLEIRHDYGDKRVLLDVHVVRDFSGTAQSLEDQPLLWVAVEELRDYAFPAANVPIVESVMALLGND
ncbi:8-oxo-dGTP diphosphatase MutT [Parahaliea mediterranea]|uniref:8-oxo-dGTP diphosphatase n=1 Tax=Parahaliea mediterranea TaxID=651086 RepID=A0A939DBV4_9GAMM|nr:8-oxo-dGTP diphosphatase MutT [Parahaliea mediterranea]MBN7795388.1 8-oxo-dGTP diphosphatase MutT [Parahaliea mediterranea]